MRAMVLEGPRRLVPRELTLDELGEDDGILRVEACGLCGTDHEQFTGALPTAGPTVPGHEVIGTVEALGPRAEARWGLRAGDRVAVAPFLACGECPRCRGGDARRCERHGLLDAYGFAPVDRPPGAWGGYAERLYLHPHAQLLPVPPALDPVVATLFNPLGAGFRWAVTLPGTGPGDVVAVLGPGIRGLSAVVAARGARAGFVMVTGRGPADHGRLAQARRLGADLVVDVAEEDPVAALRREAGGMAHVVVDVTARAPAAFAQAVALARSEGTVVIAGTRGEPGAPGFRPDDIVYKEVRLLGALGVDTDSYRAALRLLADGTPLVDVPRRVENLDGAAELLAVMAGEADGEPPVHAVLAP